MKVILAIDALECRLVEEFRCTNLMQACHGSTDITEFSEPRTMVLWSSFLCGRNMEQEVLGEGNKEMWNVRFAREETFLSFFEDPIILDLPGYSYDLLQHERERELLRSYFTATGDAEKEAVRKEYNDHAFAHHRKMKAGFLEALSTDSDLVLGYFSLADVIGHLNFGNRALMRMIYREFDELAGRTGGPLLVISDHGMEAVGMFGDHTGYGFWSTGGRDLGKPRITDFFGIIRDMREGQE